MHLRVRNGFTITVDYQSLYVVGVSAIVLQKHNLNISFAKNCKQNLIAMRFLRTLLACIVLLAATNEHVLFAQNGIIPIPIRDVGDSGMENAPRSLPESPVDCHYSLSDQTLNFSFTGNIGLVTITVFNFLTGECHTLTEDSGIGNIVIPLPENSGYFFISVVTQKGKCYFGNLQL